MKLKFTWAYLLLLVPSFIVVAVIWSCVAPDRFYHCWDNAPLVTFIPPFVHPEFPLSQQEFDHYIWPARTVYAIWFGFIAFAVFMPAMPLMFFRRFWRFYERHGLFAKDAANTTTQTKNNFPFPMRRVYLLAHHP